MPLDSSLATHPGSKREGQWMSRRTDEQDGVSRRRRKRQRARGRRKRPRETPMREAARISPWPPRQACQEPVDGLACIATGVTRRSRRQRWRTRASQIPCSLSPRRFPRFIREHPRTPNTSRDSPPKPQNSRHPPSKQLRPVPRLILPSRCSRSSRTPPTTDAAELIRFAER